MAAASQNDLVPHRKPIRPTVFAAHASSFEPPTTAERPVVYDRKLAVEEWVMQRLPSR
jgi:hypothetical protein